ncbi:MAG: flippase-like domain-containing protein [Fusobacterium sp.]|nr:flippase-like domain-containing protein [Fusobacterium sp.]
MKKKQIVLLVITIIFLVLVFNKVDFATLLETIKTFDIKYLAAIVAVFLTSLYVRGIRWKFLLMNDRKYSAFNLAEIFTVGNMLNIFMPARAGDIYRAYYLGEEKNEKKLKIFGTIILERLFDGIAMFCILLGAILLYSDAQWILNLTLGIGAVFIIGTLTFYLIFKYNKSRQVCRAIISHIKTEKIQKLIRKLTTYMNIFIKGFSAFKKPLYMLSILALSFVAWGLEATAACLIVNSFGLNLGILAGVFVLTLTSFSTMIPSTSVLVGPYQAAYILALGLFGIEKSQALAISAVHQIILILIFTLTGGLIMLKFNIKAQNPRQ